MPCYLTMNGNGNANLSAAANWSPLLQFPVFECYIQTTNAEAQVLFSTQQTGQGTFYMNTVNCEATWVGYIEGTSLYSQFTLIKGEIGFVFAASCSLPTGVTLTDGGWHQVAFLGLTVVGGDETFQFCVDGTCYDATVSLMPLREQIPPGTSEITTYLGQDMFSSPALAAPFQGSMTEIRLWSGGDGAATVLIPWAPSVGAPVGTNAPNLQGYWPFWGNNPTTQMNEQLSGTPIVLNNCSLASSYDNFYDDLSELLFNVQPQAFPQFTGTQLDAFTYLMSLLPLPNDTTPLSFRNLYTVGDTPFSAYQNTINNAPLPNGADFSSADLAAVKSQLNAELTAVISLWNYYNSSAINGDAMFSYMTEAASTVQDAITNSSYVSLDTSSSSLGTAVDIAASLLSALPGAGKAAGAILKGAWAVYSTSQGPGESIVYNPYPEAQAALNNLENDLAIAISNAQNGLLNSVLIVAQDWGRLNMILIRQSQNLSFNAIGAMSTGAGVALLNGSILNFMTSVILAGNTLNIVSDPGYTVNMPDAFWNLGGDMNYFDGQNEALVAAFVSPLTFNGPPTTFLTTINDALPSGVNLSSDEVSLWPFNVLVNPGPSAS